MKTAFSIFCLTILLAGCAGKPDRFQQLEGEWRNVSLRLVQHTIANGSLDSTLIIKNGDWDSILQMRPIRTTFHSNGTYVSRYYNLSDSLIFESGGDWHFIGDSLYLSSAEGQNAYHFQMLDDNQARFVSMLDWDSDGSADDEYDGIQQKQQK
jgi:hypothetical protein